ncbi:Uncharacterised protein [Serratia quinivorans]|nr:Uncharacterised protein [Serratia quinivorans]CAI1057235.1 Uncharacterised protein [Serratia quinivorans]CAI1215345.1 Uncharacterised protein [Serratia quinivorans]CAI1239443.1 Uncharacterised protein [Serratia quinivorans]CAI2023652.1 Uncharacterised protein [Serratia quinivorans]
MATRVAGRPKSVVNPSRSIILTRSAPVSNGYGLGGSETMADSAECLTSRQPSGHGPYSCVINGCAYARRALVTLVEQQLGGEIVSLGSPWEQLRWPREAIMVPVRMLVYRLPEALGVALDGMMFLRHFLRCHTGRYGPRSQILLITDLPAFWLFATLRNLLGEEIDLNTITVLPARSSPVHVATAFASGGAGMQLAMLAARTPASQRCSLTAREAEVLHDLLYHGRSIAMQAKLKCTVTKTLYNQQRSAMKKLGVRTLCGVMRWRGDVR